MADTPYIPSYVPPVNPADIPEGCYFVWNETTQKYDYPLITTLHPQNISEPVVNNSTTP